VETINKHNYEECFIDFFDGNLSEKEKGELFHFLQKNPVLKKEFESFETLCLKPEHIIFENKQKLIKKTQAQHFEITEFEYLCIADKEQDINTEEKKQLKSKLKDITKKKEYNVFKLLKLKADKNIIYPNKNKLFKKIVILNYRTMFSVTAAAIVLLFLVFKGSFLNQNKFENTGKHLSLKLNKDNLSKLLPEQKKINTVNKNIKKQEQILVTHNQTIKNSKINVLAFDDNEPQNTKDLYKELIVSIPDIKNEALISNINQIIIPATQTKLYTFKNNNSELNNKDKFWKYAEKGVSIWKQLTKDDDIQLINKYTENGNVNEVNFIASNFQFRKTYNKK